jgi:hypothetical protein
MHAAGRLVTNVRLELEFPVLVWAAIFVARRKINRRMLFNFRKGRRSALDSERAVNLWMIASSGRGVGLCE